MGSQDPRFRVLEGLKISGDGAQHVLRMILQRQHVHPLSRRPQPPGEVLPLLKDRFHVLYMKSAKRMFCSALCTHLNAYRSE